MPTGPSSCTFYYMTQSDPGGKKKKTPSFLHLKQSILIFASGSLPAWLMNKVSKVFVPKVKRSIFDKLLIDSNKFS